MFPNSKTLIIKTDSLENVKLDKEKSTERTDGCVALVEGIESALRPISNFNESAYDSRGLIFVKKKIN